MYYIVSWDAYVSIGIKYSKFKSCFKLPMPYYPWTCSSNKLCITVDGISILPVSSLGFILFCFPCSPPPPSTSKCCWLYFQNTPEVCSDLHSNAICTEKTSLSLPQRCQSLYFHSTCPHIYLHKWYLLHHSVRAEACPVCLWLIIQCLE